MDLTIPVCPSNLTMAPYLNYSSACGPFPIFLAMRRDNNLKRDIWLYCLSDFTRTDNFVKFVYQSS